MFEGLKDKAVRIKAMEDNFPLFFAYHFGREFKQFHLDWMLSLQDMEKDTMITGFRASRKTTMVRGRIVWLIVYGKEPSIIRQSYEDTLSAESVRSVAKMLCTKSIVNDYGYLFPFQAKREDIVKKSFNNFEATNGVKISSRSLGQTLRGENTFDMQNEQSARPTVLVLDDIDVNKSVENVDIIDKNEKKILGETIPALDPLRRKVVFLGNIIVDDGVVPRFHKRYKDMETWDCFRQPLIDENGVNCRPEVFTDKVVKTLQDDGKTSFGQNYLLIPSSLGTGVFIRDYFDYFLTSHFEQVDGILQKIDLDNAIFIDPAFSTDAKSDDACIIGMAEHKITKQYYLIDGYADVSAPSKTIQAVIVMYNNMVANGFHPKYISVESVKLNKQQTQFVADLRAELVRNQINVPLYEYNPKGKKLQRIKDNLESIMSQKGIKFNRNMRDSQFIPSMERQFLDFPNGDHDDIIDTVSQAVRSFRNQPKPKIHKSFASSAYSL